MTGCCNRNFQLKSWPEALVEHGLWHCSQFGVCKTVTSREHWEVSVSISQGSSKCCSWSPALPSSVQGWHSKHCPGRAPSGTGRVEMDTLPGSPKGWAHEIKTFIHYFVLLPGLLSLLWGFFWFSCWCPQLHISQVFGMRLNKEHGINLSPCSWLVQCRVSAW